MTDKERLNNLFSRIREFDFPECDTEDGQAIVSEIKAGFDIILDGMKTAANNVKQNEESSQE